MAEARIPPQNIEAEKAVLGALLTSKDAFDAVYGTVDTEDFYRDPHRVIYDALLRIYKKNKRADMILLVEELERTKKLEEVGGIAYITLLANDTSASFNVEEHARIVNEKAHLRKLIDAGNKIVGMSYEGEEEPSEIIDTAERLVLAVKGAGKGETSFTSMGTLIADNMELIYDIARHRGSLTGIPTGFRDLDKLTNGLQRSDLILVAARPSMGKTAFTLNLAQHAAVTSGQKVAFFSLEMSKIQLANRVLASVSGISSNKLRTGQFEDKDWASLVSASQTLSEAPLFIDDTPGLTAQDMRSKLRRLKAEQGGLDLVIVDYIQLMQGRSTKSSENRQQEISEISRNLKLIAREMNVPLVALSQLSRGVESRTDKRPVLSDLRESGSLEQDADIVTFLYRDWYYASEADRAAMEQDITEVIIRKHRNGELGTVKLLFDGALTRFYDTTFREDEGIPG